MLATFADNNPTLNISLTTANEAIGIVANATTVTLTDTGGTWSGTDTTNVVGNGTNTLTITAAGETNLTLVAIIDAAAGTAVNFNNSGANSYVENFSVALTNAAAGPITFAGATAFTGAHTLSASTTNGIAVNAAVSSVTGAITLGSGTAITETGSLGTTSLLTANAVTGVNLTGANTVSSFASTNTTSGSLTLADSAAEGLSTNTISETGGNVSITNKATGGLSINGGITSASPGNVTLTTVGAGHNVAYGAAGFSDALGGLLTVNSAGSITHSGSGDDIRALTTVLHAATGIGASGASLQVSTSSLTVTNSTSGDEFLATDNGGSFGATGASLTNSASPGNITLGSDRRAITDSLHRQRTNQWQHHHFQCRQPHNFRYRGGYHDRLATRSA